MGKKFEYQTFEGPSHLTRIEFLNEKGADGWQLLDWTMAGAIMTREVEGTVAPQEAPSKGTLTLQAERDALYEKLTEANRDLTSTNAMLRGAREDVASLRKDLGVAWGERDDLLLVQKKVTAEGFRYALTVDTIDDLVRKFFGVMSSRTCLEGFRDALVKLMVDRTS